MGILLGCFCMMVLLSLGFFVGSFNEKRHLKSLERREEETRHILVTDLRGFTGGALPKAGGTLVISEVVIATDYFKNFLAMFVKIVGGELRAYRSLMERARREATMRLKEEAVAKGYNAICNVRMETMDLTVMNPKQQAAMVCVTAYGTAYYIPRDRG